MGKTRKKHNWKARQQAVTKIVGSEEKKVDVELEGFEKDPVYGDDESNVLVLPSQKRKTKVQSLEIPRVKPLSKKQRKKLEKIVERKEKKAQRADLLEKLATVQATDEEKALLTSTTEVYSGKYKRKLVIESTPSGHVKVNAISGSNKKRKHAPKEESVESSSEDSFSEEESDEEESETENPETTEQEQTSEKDRDDSEEKDANNDTDSAENQSTGTSSSKTTKLEIAEPDKISYQRKTVNIPVNRGEEIQAQRLKLPILGEEQVVMEAINSNPVVIICGETGSGKTTQVPQFLYEAGYAHGDGIIAVTEPRRVAAISMSKRIAYEMNLSSREVSYQIRYEGNVTPDTKIKFLTDGVLLKEVQQDFLLTKYSVVVVDEAHERSVYTDILLGLLSRIVPLRHKKGNPLKIIVMSATLRVEDFTENKRLFRVTPPILKIDSRQFPVTVHFNKRTPIDDYMGEAFKKICKIHRMLPEGGILVFVTGQAEVHSLCAKLRRTFPFSTKGKIEKRKSRKKEQGKEEKEKDLPKIKLEDYSVLPLDEEAELGDGDGTEDEEELSDVGGADTDDEDHVPKASAHETPMFVLPLYSLLSGDKQAKVFEPPPEGSRLCVVATNVAETSLTIPNVKYVVDTGKVKTKFYDKVTGVSTFKVTWTSQASANQRSGRAGRTGPGHSYRLYSSAVFNDDFEKFTPPEIKQRPVDDLLLQMKAMGIDKVANFPFPTPPDSDALLVAEELLISLGALENPPTPKRFKDNKKAKADPCSKVTPLGRTMANFPVAPRYGKMLSLGHQHNLLPYVVAIVAALSVQEVFCDIQQLVGTEEEKEQQKQSKLKTMAIRKTWAGSGNSLKLGDLMVLLKAVGACEYAGCSPEFCSKYGIRYKAITEIRKLRAQLTNSVNSVIPDADLLLDPKMQPPNDDQARLLRQVVLAGLGDHVARKFTTVPTDSEEAKKLKHAYQTMLLEEPAYIHPNSVLYKQDPEYLVYQQIDETSKLYMKGVTAVDVELLPLFIPSRCRFSKPADDPSPRYDPANGTMVCHMDGTFGPHFWPIPLVELEYPNNLDKYKWFARSFLEGSVCPKLKTFVPSLLSSPSIMIKSWAKLQSRTETFLKTLLAEEVCSLHRLKSTWENNPSYLLKAYSEWIPQAQHPQLNQIWPPL